MFPRLPGIPFPLFLISGLLGATADIEVPSNAKALTPRHETSIPYPNGGMYLRRGIHGAFSGGRHKNQGEAQGLYQWQGEMGYFYTPWLSGGIGFKMNAGEPSDSVQKVKNRFFIMGRFHYKPLSRISGYFGTQVGVDDLNVSLSPVADSGNFREPLRETNAGMDFELGLGWKLTRHFGLTFAQRLELSLVGEESQNPESAVNFRSLPGVALDLLPFFPTLGETVKALHVFTELQFGKLIRASDSRSRDFAWIGGVSLAF